MHLRTSNPTFSDHAVAHSPLGLVVLRSLTDRGARVEPGWIYDLIPGVQLDNDAVVEWRSLKNLAFERALDIASREARHVGKRSNPFREGDLYGCIAQRLQGDLTRPCIRLRLRRRCC